MRLEDQVCSIDRARLLFKFLGWRFKTAWCYEIESEDSEGLTFTMHDCPFPDLKDYFIPAYTVAELGALLVNNTYETTCYPCDGLFYFDFVAEYNRAFDVPMNEQTFETKVFQSNKEADSRADALIWLLENDKIKAEDLKL